MQSAHNLLNDTADLLFFTDYQTELYLDFLQDTDPYPSAPDIAEDSPIIYLKAINNLLEFSSIHLLKPSEFDTLDESELLYKGMEYAKNYHLKGSFLYIELETRYIKTFEYFCIGFLLEASKRFHIVLNGDETIMQMLLKADDMREKLLMRIQHKNISITNSSNTKALEKLSYDPDIIEAVQSKELLNELEIIKECL